MIAQTVMHVRQRDSCIEWSVQGTCSVVHWVCLLERAANAFLTYDDVIADWRDLFGGARIPPSRSSESHQILDRRFSRQSSVGRDILLLLSGRENCLLGLGRKMLKNDRLSGISVAVTCVNGCYVSRDSISWMEIAA